MKDPKYFIVIDDDAINNKICRTVIEKIYVDADVNTFTDPILGFEYIVSEYSKKENENNAILFLDINMPVMDAWEFLTLFDRLDDEVRNKITIFMLSSSVNKSDMERAMSNRNVSYYLIKPLTKESIKLITNLTVRKKQQDGAHVAAAPVREMPAPRAVEKVEEVRENDPLKTIKLKDELVHRHIPELEKAMNNMLFDIEKKFKELGLYIEPITVSHSAFDRNKGGKMQLNIHFFDYSRDGVHHFHDGAKLNSL
jgi:two-component system, chemotaxis family, chemotaxis protein CheY